MKKITITFLLATVIIISFAQSPQAFKYQAVARDSAGEILANQNVSFQISILQGSASGTIVYTETHDTTTNGYGLVNLEIGNGLIVSGDFASISWGADNYFLQIEMDAAGGSNYQLMGTSQLMSVPYALYAGRGGDPSYSSSENSPDSVVFVENSGNVGIGTTSPESSALLELESETKGFLPPRMTWMQRDALTPVEGLIIYNTTLSNFNYYDGTQWIDLDGNRSPTYEIGAYAFGGVIFYLDDNGGGMVVALEDAYHTYRYWGCMSTNLPGADATAIGTGAQNTADILAACSESNCAARYCDDFVSNGYDDWFLPSKNELNLICQNQDLLETTALQHGGSSFGTHYWSSSEEDLYYAWNQQFYDCLKFLGQKNIGRYVRAVRAFSAEEETPHTNSNWIVSGSDLYPAVWGNVGIGTSTPIQKLHVDGHSYFDGRVGIGTSSPSKNLDVVGNIKASGYMLVDSDLHAPGGEEELRIIRGNVNADGSISAGSGFSVVHNATGEYTITYTDAFPGGHIPTVVATIHDDPDNVCAVYSSNTSGFEIHIRDVAGAANESPQDDKFAFIVMGRR